MSLFKEERAQLSLEVMIMIAGAIIVVTVVGIVVKNMTTVAAGRAADVNALPP